MAYQRILRRDFLAIAFLSPMMVAMPSTASLVDARWNGGAGPWNAPSNWTPSVIPTNGIDTYNVLIDDGNATASEVTLNISATVDSLTLDANDTLNLSNALILSINGGALANSGLLTMNSSGSVTQLRAGGTVMITGGGEIALSDSPNNRIVGLSAGDRFVNVDNLIHGAGQIGLNTHGFTNQSLVRADLPTALTLDPPASGDVLNSGTLQADGGTLRLNTGDYLNAAGIIEAQDGSMVELAGAVVHGGMLQTSGSGVVRVTSASTLDGSVDPVTNDGLFEVANATVANVSGTLVNLDTLMMNSTGSVTQLVATSNEVLLTGGGDIMLSNSPNNRIVGNSSANRFNNVDNTIHGAGNIGVNVSGFANASLVVADQPIALTIDPGASSDITNSGILRADAGAILHLNPGDFINAGGIIEAINASVVELGGAVIQGGTLQTSSDGVIRAVLASTLDGSGTAIANTGALDVKNAVNLVVQGELNNSGTVSVSSTGSVTGLYATGGEALLTGGGDIVLADAPNNRIAGAAVGDYFVNVDNTISGSGLIGVNTNGFDNLSLVVANQSTTLTLDPPGAIAFLNSGIYRADGGILQLNAGAYTNTSGEIEALDGSTVTLGSGVVIDGGVLRSEGSGFINAIGSAIEIADVTNEGLLKLANVGILDITGTLTNSGTLTMNSSGSLTQLRAKDGDAFLTGGGEIIMSNFANNRIVGVTTGDRLTNVDNTIRGAGSIGLNTHGFTNQGTLIADQSVAMLIDPPTASDFLNEGTMIASGAGGITLAAGAAITSGQVIVNAGSVLNRAGTYVQTAGSTIVNGVLNATTDLDIQGGILGGTGTINDGVVSAGTVSPGESAGLLTIDDTYQQTGDGELLIEIGGTGLGTEYDRLAVTGAATLDGTLRIEFVNDYVPVVGHTFDVMTYASHSGNFTNLDVPCLPAGQIVQVTVSETLVRVSISDALVGDANCDCALSAEDIDAFLLALLDPDAYVATYTNCTGLTSADMNGDFVVDGRDVQPFVEAFLP